MLHDILIMPNEKLMILCSRVLKYFELSLEKIQTYSVMITSPIQSVQSDRYFQSIDFACEGLRYTAIFSSLQELGKALFCKSDRRAYIQQFIVDNKRIDNIFIDFKTIEEVYIELDLKL